MTTKPPFDSDKTSVDLGEDLLRTKTLVRPAPGELASAASAPAPAGEPVSAPRPSEESVDEMLVNAKIYQSEDLLEDAKRTLRRVLLKDPGNRAALDRLKEIQGIEIKRLLGESGPKKSLLKRPKARGDDDDVSRGEVILAELEKELGGPEDMASPFEDEAEKKAFLARVELRCAESGTSPRDRVDLAVAFVEMGLPEAAVEQLAIAARDPELRVAATEFKAFALILSGRAFDALMELEPLVQDEGREPADKLELGYLMGRAHEGVAQHARAAEWYRGVMLIDPHYRDCGDRLVKCEKILSSSSRS